MLTARVDITAHTSNTVDIDLIVFPTASTDPQIGGIDVLDNSVPPLTLLGHRIPMPDCLASLGVDPRFPIRGIPKTRLPIQVIASLCMTGEMVNLGTFLAEMSPRTGAVPCSSDVILPPSAECIAAQADVNGARRSYLDECTNIAEARGRRDSAIAAAGATGAVGIGASAAAAAIVAALIAAAHAAATATAIAAAVPYVGWVTAAVLALIAIGFLIAMAVFLSRFNAALNDLTAAYGRQVQSRTAFNDAVAQVNITCCAQQLPRTFSLEAPTCPS